MSILDNIGDNLDKQHENHNFLPQKIELEDIDLGIRDYFKSLNITLMDSNGRQIQVPIIWLNQEQFAQRKNYWEGLTNENGEEISRPFIVMARKGVKQGTAPSRRTIPWMKKFGFTRPRTFDGTLLGYDKYLVRQATWVDCEYEVRLITSYMVDVNVFYQEILRDGFSDGQGYMNINGHQVRSVLGEPSEENQTANIEDERVFQIVAPVTVFGKLFDPSQFEKKTTIQKVSLRVCEQDSKNEGFSRTFGGQSSQSPFIGTCSPSVIYDFNGIFLSSVPSGGQYTVPSSKVLWSSGGTIVELAPNQEYKLSPSIVLNHTGGTVFNDIEQGQIKTLTPALVQDVSGNTLSQLAPDGIYVVSASTGEVTILWSSGGTVAIVDAGDNYQLSASTVLNHTGGTVFNDIEQGQVRSLVAARVEDVSGNTLALLAPNGLYIAECDACCKFENTLVIFGAGTVDANGDYRPDGDINSTGTTWVNKENGWFIAWENGPEGFGWYINNDAASRIYYLNINTPPIGVWSIVGQGSEPAPKSTIIECIPFGIYVNDNLVSNISTGCTSADYEFNLLNTTGGTLRYDQNGQDLVVRDGDIRIASDFLFSYAVQNSIVVDIYQNGGLVTVDSVIQDGESFDIIIEDRIFRLAIGNLDIGVFTGMTVVVPVVDRLGNIVESPKISNSGGTLVINALPCSVATWTLMNSLEEELQNGEIESGESQRIIAPNGRATAVDVWGNILGTTEVPSGGGGEIEVSISGCCTLINSFTTEGGGEAESNGTWTFVGGGYTNDAGWIIQYIESQGWIMTDPIYRDTYYLSDDVQFPWQGTWQIGPYGTGPVPTFEQICEPCGEGEDVVVQVSGETVGSFSGGSTVNILLNDGTDPVVPVETVVSGQTVNIQIPAGEGASCPKSLRQFIGIDSNFEPPEANVNSIGENFYNLNPTTNPALVNHYLWPSNGYKRFTGKAGGYYDEVNDTFHLADGTVTTKANAFPDGVFLDWAQAAWEEESVPMFPTGDLRHFNPDGPNTDTYVNKLAVIEAATIHGETGWTIPTLKMLYNLSIEFGNNVFRYEPIGMTENTTINSCTRRSSTLFRGIATVTGNSTSNNLGSSTGWFAYFKNKPFNELTI